MVGDTSFGVSANYLEFIERYGKAVIITPMDALELPDVDMLIAPGGSDLSPSSYGAKPSYRTQKPNIYLEYFDSEILPRYIEQGTPVFGICRGMQRLWAMYGGAICQHNGWHKQSESHKPWEQCHELEFTEPFKDYRKLINKVTSRHHQCADATIPEMIPPELEVIAYAKEGNQALTSVVEIFRHRTLKIFGVQFHPEDHDGSDQLSPMVIEEFLNI